MIVCVECRREMSCDRNSVGANFGNGRVYPADRFKCPECGKMILSTNRIASFDPDLTYQDEYLTMKEGNND